MDRYFIVFFDVIFQDDTHSQGSVNHVAQDGHYVNHDMVTKEIRDYIDEAKSVAIINIIELNESDYDDFFSDDEPMTKCHIEPDEPWPRK